MKLISIAPSDYPQLAKMAAEIWHAHYNQIISEEQIDYMLQLMYSESSLKKQVEEGQEFYFLVDEMSEKLGFLSYSLKEKGIYFLHKFYVLTNKQNLGVGAKAFNQFLKSNDDIKEVKLTVNRQNFKSINFYFKLGFKIESCEDFDIGNGYFMNDFVMKYPPSRL